MKLNLACGNKKLEDYIGVDLHGGDVRADILALPKEWSGKADEILIVHGLEHLAFYQIQTALAEWRRVLKPGGLLAIECPNLKEACRQFLMDSSKLNRGLWPIYGDQTQGRIEDVHKSGWTPESLMKELQTAGFRGVCQAPAQFKLREPRDFRLEATKP